MRIVVEIPDNEVPKTQEVVATYIHFIDGEVCELGNYGVMTLPKGHGDLIDRDDVLFNKYKIASHYLDYDEVVNVQDINDIKAIVPADKGE